MALVAAEAQGIGDSVGLLAVSEFQIASQAIVTTRLGSKFLYPRRDPFSNGHNPFAFCSATIAARTASTGDLTGP